MHDKDDVARWQSREALDRAGDLIDKLSPPGGALLAGDFQKSR